MDMYTCICIDMRKLKLNLTQHMIQSVYLFSEDPDLLQISETKFHFHVYFFGYITLWCTLNMAGSSYIDQANSTWYQL